MFIDFHLITLSVTSLSSRAQCAPTPLIPCQRGLKTQLSYSCVYLVFDVVIISQKCEGKMQETNDQMLSNN